VSCISPGYSAFLVYMLFSYVSDFLSAQALIEEDSVSG